MAKPTRPLIEVVVHEATRSGSIQVMLDLVDAASASGRYEFRITPVSGGPLADACAARSTAPAHRRPDAIWINSAVTLGQLPERVTGSELPISCYVHEDEEGLAVLAPDAIEFLRDRCRSVWCVSEGVRQQLGRFDISPEHLVVLPPVITPSARASQPDCKPDCRAGVERSIGDGPLFVGCGIADWHKGPDLFLDVARRIRAELGEARFLWIGARPRHWARVLAYDTAEMGLDEAFEWIGPVENPLEYFESATAVVSTSRREAWPVVPMEAGLVGVATVAFEVGGCAEMGALGLIRTVEFPDTAALAAAAMELHESPDTRTNLVRAIGEHVAQHQSPAVIGPRFLSMLDGLCEDRPR